MASETSLDTKVAVLDRSLSDCQKTEAECRATNREQHGDFYARIGKLETTVAVIAARVALAAAIGSVVGGAIVAAIMRKLVG